MYRRTARKKLQPSKKPEIYKPLRYETKINLNVAAEAAFRIFSDLINCHKHPLTLGNLQCAVYGSFCNSENTIKASKSKKLVSKIVGNGLSDGTIIVERATKNLVVTPITELFDVVEKQQNLIEEQQNLIEQQQNELERVKMEACEKDKVIEELKRDLQQFKLSELDGRKRSAPTSPSERIVKIPKRKLK